MNGSSQFVPSAFSLAIATPGTVILLDEISRCPVVALSPLFALMDDFGSVTVEPRDKDVGAFTVTRATNTVILFARNKGTGYNVLQFDAALQSRARRVDLSAMDPTQLARILEVQSQGKVAPAILAALGYCYSLAHAINDVTGIDGNNGATVSGVQSINIEGASIRRLKEFVKEIIDTDDASEIADAFRGHIGLHCDGDRNAAMRTSGMATASQLFQGLMDAAIRAAHGRIMNRDGSDWSADDTTMTTARTVYMDAITAADAS